MILGTDNTGKVLLVSSGTDVSIMPTEFNGVSVTRYALTPNQISDYASLPQQRGGTMFDGTTFTALPVPFVNNNGAALLQSRRTKALEEAQKSPSFAALLKLIKDA